MILKDFDRSLKPREKVLDQGIEALSDSELLALILRSGLKGTSAIDQAREILNHCGGFAGLFQLDLPQLMEIEGLGLAKSCEILACLEIVKRTNYQKMLQADVIAEPQLLINWLQNYIGNRQQEYFIVVFLDGQKHVLSYQPLYIGSRNTLNIDPSELFSKALSLKASSIIVAHNHPSQKAIPSEIDNLTTRKLMEAGELINVPLLDHLIIAFNDYYSYRQHQII